MTAKGSTKSFGGWEPKRCCICGERLVLTGPKALRFHHEPGRVLSWHVDCEEPGWPHLA